MASDFKSPHGFGGVVECSAAEHSNTTKVRANRKPTARLKLAPYMAAIYLTRPFTLPSFFELSTAPYSLRSTGHSHCHDC